VGVMHTELLQMLAPVQQEAIADQTGLQRYCVQPRQASYVLIAAPHAFAFFFSQPKPSKSMLSCCFSCLQSPVSQYNNGAMQRCHV